MNPATYAALCAEAYTAPLDFSAGGIAQGIIRDTEDGRCIAFQGTQDIAQVLADLDVGTIHVPLMGDVHRGFLMAARSVRFRIGMALEDKPAIITGHSLGGAIAIVLAAHRCLAGQPPKAVITFGAPRVSIGPAMAHLFAKWAVPVMMYRHAADPVPEVPLNLPIADWRHPADLIQLGEKRAFPDIEDHRIAHYVAALATT